MNLWFQVQHSPFYTNWAFTYKTETLGNLYSHALSSSFKNQVVIEQKFKDLISSKCPVSVERRVLDLESKVMRGLGSIPKILLLDLLFSHSKASDVNVGIIANFVYYGNRKTRLHNLKHVMTLEPDTLHTETQVF